MKSPPTTKTSMVKSPSLGKEDFDKSLNQNNFSSKFYDDDVTNMFLGGN